jgi:hypothetical protein
VFVCQTAAEVCLDQHINVVDVKGAVDCLGTVLDLMLVLLVFSIAERDVVVNISFKLTNFFSKQGEIFNDILEEFSGILVKINSLSILAFLEFGGGQIFLLINFLLQFVEFGLLLFLLFVIII